MPQLGHKIEDSQAQLGHKEVKFLVAQMGNNLRTGEREVSSGTVEAQLGKHFSSAQLGQG